MDFFYHLLAISSRFTVFVEVREDQVRIESRMKREAEIKALEDKRLKALQDEQGYRGAFTPGASY